MNLFVPPPKPQSVLDVPTGSILLVNRYDGQSYLAIKAQYPKRRQGTLDFLVNLTGEFFYTQQSLPPKQIPAYTYFNEQFFVLNLTENVTLNPVISPDNVSASSGGKIDRGAVAFIEGKTLLTFLDLNTNGEAITGFLNIETGMVEEFDVPRIAQGFACKGWELISNDKSPAGKQVFQFPWPKKEMPAPAAPVPTTTP